MTITDLVADVIVNELGTSMNAQIQLTIAKRPTQNTYLNSLNGKLNARGIQSIIKAHGASMEDSEISILWDGLPTLERKGVWQSIINSDITRYVVGLASSYELENFDGNWILDSETTVEDTGLLVTLTIWKRIKVRI